MRIAKRRSSKTSICQFHLEKSVPYAVCVELEQLAELLDEHFRLLDDLRAGSSHNTRSLHRVPARALSHHVPERRGEEEEAVRTEERSFCMSLSLLLGSLSLCVFPLSSYP